MEAGRRRKAEAGRQELATSEFSSCHIAGGAAGGQAVGRCILTGRPLTGIPPISLSFSTAHWHCCIFSSSMLGSDWAGWAGGGGGGRGTTPAVVVKMT